MRGELGKKIIHNLVHRTGGRVMGIKAIDCFEALQVLDLLRWTTGHAVSSMVESTFDSRVYR